ncbi:MAG: type II toxin-antitoxin system RelE/ParE family toxin [Allosphingosinicella sp.]
MRVVLADTAHADLKEISDWIGADDWDHAESFRRSLLDKCRTLGSNPRRYPLVLRSGARNLRKLSYRDYLILYQLLETEVEVIRVVHGKRDWIALVREGPGQ